MIINKNTLKINSIEVGKYVVEATFDYHKLWDKDAGRNMAGTMKGTLIGIFPKITLQFRGLNKSELEIIAPLLDSKNPTITYYDPVKKITRTMTTYTNDWGTVQRNIARVSGFSCAFISVSKR